MRTRSIAVLALVCVVMGGCAVGTELAELRYPLPKDDGPKRQLNKGLWDWTGEKGGTDAGQG